MSILFVLACALAMCLGWGIRGQFGGETGAMVPGALIGLALALMSGWKGRDAVKLGAVGAFACSFGGMETYGQTIWLVQGENPSPTYWWGLLGLFIKGGAWIGITGVFLAIALSDRYRTRELLALMVGMLLLGYIGVQLLNRPHNPPEELPLVYFSKRFDPKPRVEWWGGLWFTLIGLMVYTGVVKKHAQAVKMALWGIVGGGIGFSFGEVLQCWGTHNKPFGDAIQRWIDWWKVMEMGFGFIAGAALGLGWRMLKLHQARMPQITPWHPAWDALTIALWVIPGIAIDFGVSWAEGWSSQPYVWMLLGLLGSLAGRVWAPFGVGVAVTLVSASDTVRYLVDEKKVYPLVTGVAWFTMVATVSAVLTWLWSRRLASAYVWWLWTVWVQTALTWIKYLPPVLYAADGQNWFVRWGSGGVVEVTFVLLALMLSLYPFIRKESFAAP